MRHVDYTLVLFGVFMANSSCISGVQADSSEASEEGLPPYTDYCEMLSQEIQGRKHAFLAGNKTYYVGGIHHCWNLSEDETIGLTHPFFHDLRGRGFGLVENEGSGFGHDFRGWEFYTKTRVAIGTVVIGGKQYPSPVPVSMKWRPDKVICDYVIDGVKIHEEKFIANNDVVCSYITSDSPVRLLFRGQSLYIPGLSLTSTAQVTQDDTSGAIHISEGGTVTTHPVRDVAVSGKLVYDGMSTVLSASSPIDKFATTTDEKGQCSYTFETSCDESGVAIAWAMDDEYSVAQEAVREVLYNVHGEMSAKTKVMNDILNYQIPYFRCSDQEIVDIYYYLWAIHMMYYIDVQEGWEMYPHTQTAVNNFLGMHRYDANFQIQVGAWTADKERYAYGNVLHWKPLLPYAREGGSLPDNKGIGWFSPVWGTTTEHVIGAWKIYQRTGDVGFLHDCYDEYFKVLFKDGMHSHWGCHYDAAKYLREMAVLTNDREDPDRWLELVNLKGGQHWLNDMWEKHHKHYFGGAPDSLGWSGFAYMRNSYFPEEWALQMTRSWAMNSKDGFFWKVPLSSRSIPDLKKVKDPEFSSTPDTNYYALIGMYNSNVGRDANRCTLAHLKSYNMNWGIPIAPEAWDSEPAPWGDQYSNFNAGKILLFLEGMAGVDYSIPNSTLTISDNMPEEWDSMELRVPMEVDGKMHWPIIEFEREQEEDVVIKTISVIGNPLKKTRLQPWLEEGSLIKAPRGFSRKGQGRGHVGRILKTKPKMSVSIKIRKQADGSVR